jgi:hypothetical protein
MNLILRFGEGEGTISMYNYSKIRTKDLLPSVQKVIGNFKSLISKGIESKVL